ncbi:MAG: energy transducer TonB, partial [Pseudomonadota bacterium]
TMRVARKPALPGPGAQAPQPGGEKAAAGPAVRTEAAAQGQSRGKDRAAAAPSAGLSEGESRAAMARWGGKLRARIDRAKSYPAGARASGRSGRVVLALTVSPAGRVLGVSVTASSGVPELDRAAVEAVRRAGRLPRAPQELAGAAYDFSLSIDFAL